MRGKVCAADGAADGVRHQHASVRQARWRVTIEPSPRLPLVAIAGKLIDPADRTALIRYVTRKINRA
jgi:hypothetical protein